MSVRPVLGTLTERGAISLTFERESADWLTFADNPAGCADVITIPGV